VVPHEYHYCARHTHPSNEYRATYRAAGRPQRRTRPPYRTAQLTLPTFGLILARASEAAYLTSVLDSGELSRCAPNSMLEPAHALGATTERAYLCGLLDIGEE